MGTKIIGSMRKGVLENALKNRLKALPSSKLWLSLQSERYLQQEAFSRHQKLFPPRGKLQQKLRLNSSAVHSKPISLTAEDFQQRSRDSQLYGKSQFYIRFRKTGMDHTLTVSPAMIRGEPIISISALKVPLCRQRFLRICPMYLSHTDRMGKKEEAGEAMPEGAMQGEAMGKEVQMTSAHGNKIAAGAICVCLITLALLFGEMLLEKKARIRLYEKQYTEALSSLEKGNRDVMNAHENYMKAR